MNICDIPHCWIGSSAFSWVKSSILGGSNLPWQEGNPQFPSHSTIHTCSSIARRLWPGNDRFTVGRYPHNGYLTVPWVNNPPFSKQSSQSTGVFIDLEDVSFLWKLPQLGVLPPQSHMPWGSGGIRFGTGPGWSSSGEERKVIARPSRLVSSKSWEN